MESTMGMVWRSLIFLLFLGILLRGVAWPAVTAQASSRPGTPPPPVVEQTKGLILEVTPDERLTAEINDRSLSDVLRAMADKNLFDIRGSLPSGETVSMSFTGVTLSDALKKLMRGYNYVLLRQGPSRKPLLAVMGKIERVKSTEQRTQPAASPATALQERESDRFYVPPSEPAELPAKKSPQTAKSPARSPRPAGAGARPDTGTADQTALTDQRPADKGPEENGSNEENSPVGEKTRSTREQQRPGVDF
jgi:hypothetical protein